MAMSYTPPEGQHWVLWLDCEVTRRKLYHIVTDSNDRTRFRSRFVSECIAFLANEGVEAYLQVVNDHRSLGLALKAQAVRST